MDEFSKLNASERRIIEAVRSLAPWERMEIVADSHGKPETFLITRTTKAILTVAVLTPIK